MKALGILTKTRSQITDDHQFANMYDEAIEEIKTLQQELKQGQENYNKLWEMYSETKDCMYCKEAKAIKIWDERNNK